MTELLALAVGALAGAVALWLWARGEIGKYRAQLAAAEEKVVSQDEKHRAQLVAADEKLDLVAKTQGQWEEHLKALTGEAISTSSSSLLALTEAKLLPIKETLDRFDEQARALEQKRLTAVGGIDELMRAVNAGQTRLQKETGSLVTALRAPHVRGRWGEVQLKRVIELAGMVAHCDFDEQASERDDEGRLLRPDLVVRLPGGKSIVIDSKFSLEALLDAAATEDENERRAHLARHAKLVREHMVKLGQKSYWKLFDHSPEFVVMFYGDESWFRAALDHDPSLLEAGGPECRVIPASPTTLIALLRTVAYGWQQETVAESAREVSKLGRELHDRLGIFTGHFAGVGKSLDAAIKNYNQAVGSFETRVLVSARKFPELGAGGDEIPNVPPITTQARPLLAAAALADIDGVPASGSVSPERSAPSTPAALPASLPNPAYEAPSPGIPDDGRAAAASEPSEIVRRELAARTVRAAKMASTDIPVARTEPTGASGPDEPGAPAEPAMELTLDMPIELIPRTADAA